MAVRAESRALFRPMVSKVVLLTCGLSCAATHDRTCRIDALPAPSGAVTGVVLRDGTTNDLEEPGASTAGFVLNPHALERAGHRELRWRLDGG